MRLAVMSGIMQAYWWLTRLLLHLDVEHSFAGLASQRWNMLRTALGGGEVMDGMLCTQEEGSYVRLGQRGSNAHFEQPLGSHARARGQ